MSATTSSPGTARIADSITELIGRTPLVRLRMGEGTGATSWASWSPSTPPAASRTASALAMIEAAERDGQITPGRSTIIEPTRGNTGIALAFVAAAKGYRCVLTMPETMSLERRVAAARLGAELVLTPGPEGMRGAIARAERTRPHDARQPSCPSSSRTRPTPRSTARPPPGRSGTTPTARSTCCVAGVGTGGTITGVGEVLKRAQARASGRSPSSRPTRRCSPAASPARTRSRASAPASCPRSSTRTSTTRSIR